MDLYTVRNEINSGRPIFDLPLRVTFYARVSTGTDEQTHSLQNQISYYAGFIQSNPNWTFVEGYIDEALSGTSVSKREAFLRMIGDAKKGKFDFIITKEISRFSRNTLDSIRYTQELLAAGVGVLFQSDNINTLTPDAELRLTIMASIAQDEVRKISERVRFGFKRAIEKGVVLGNSKIWGYTKQGGRLAIVPEEAEMIRQVFSMYATQNMGIRAICARLNEQGYKNGNGNDFSFSTIKGILMNPKYMGYYCGNKTHKVDYRRSDVKVMDESEWVVYKDEDNVPPIVTEEMWNRANAVLKARSEKMSAEDRSSYQNKYAYSGKIVCGEHGVPCYRAEYRYVSGNKEVWQCREYSAKGKAGCASPTVYTIELDMILRDVCHTLIRDKTGIIRDLIEIYSAAANNSQIREEIAKHRAAINGLEKRKDKLFDLSIKGHLSDDEFSKRNRQFNSEIDSLQSRIEGLQAEELKNREIPCKADTLHRMIAEELDFEEGFNGPVVNALLDRIVTYKTEDKKIIDLQVFFKVLYEDMRWRVVRSGKTSVCSVSYICSAPTSKPRSPPSSGPSGRARSLSATC
jgi:DNA invertase Pin-like site-specific DNA recombinase